MFENSYHRYLDISVKPNIDLFAKTDYDPDTYCHIKIDDDQINPELVKRLKEFGLAFWFVEAFYTPPNGGKLPIHTDTAFLCDVVKVNWTYGAPGSKTIWWQSIDENKITKHETVLGAEYLTIEEQYCKKLYEAEINQPSLLNVGQFHSTWNPTTEKRWTLSLPIVDINTNERISWTDAISRFQNIII